MRSPHPAPIRRISPRFCRSAAAVGAALASTALLVSVGGEASSAASGTPHHPSPSHFTAGHVTNEWFPLKPGTVLVYRGFEKRQRSRDVSTSTYTTHVVDGVTCRVVSDRLFLDGVLVERTKDYYAQTKRGTVWYFGERTAELDRNGRVTSREGSFLSGKHGAQAGVFMPAHPRVGQSYLQENDPGNAQDRFRIESLSGHTRTPVLASTHALRTEETTRLEPGIVEHKNYIRDIGPVSARIVEGPREYSRLVEVSHRPAH
jgi:hypothetical protein